MYKLLFLAAASVWSWAAPAQSVREVADARILSFEESAAPFTASEGSSLSVSGDHYKHGAHALRWQWSRAGARVRIESPVGYLSENPNPRETSVSTFVFWGLRPEGARRETAFRVPQGGAHLRVVRLRTGVHRLARGMGGFRPRHAGPARGGDGRTGRHGGGRRTGRVVFRPPDSLLVSGRAAPYGRFPGAVHQRRDHEPLAHAAAIVAQSDARTPRRGR